MNGVNTQFSKVLNSPRLRKGKILARMLGRWLIDRKVAMVHLVNHNVLRLSTYGLITLPPFRISIAHIYNYAFFAVYRHRFSKNAWRSLSINNKLISLTFVITLSCCSPDTISTQCHRQAVFANDNNAVSIIGSEEAKNGLTGRVGHLIEMEGLFVCLTGKEKSHHTENK